MKYITTVDFILETLCVLSMFSFGLGSSITTKKFPRAISILLFFISLTLILSGVYDAFVFLLVFICLLPLFVKQFLYFISWFMVYMLGFNFISAIVQIAVLLIYGKFYLSSPSVLPIYAMIDNIILAGILLFFYVIRNTKRKRMEAIKYLKKKEYALLLCTSLLDFIILVMASAFIASSHLSYSLNEKGKFIFCFSLIALVLLSIVIFYLFCSTLRKNITLQEINKLNAENLALEEKYYETLYQKNQDLRAFRHDFQNHVLALNTLVEENNWEGIQQYLSDFTATKEQTAFFSTNSAIADAIINEFYDTLPGDITFHVEGQFPYHLPVANMDISIILSNLLKNAREACEHLTGDTEKEISLEIQNNNRQLLIRTENSSRKYSPDEILYLETSKKDAINHGFGLKNIYSSVKKYHGTMDMQYQNGYFMVMLILEKEPFPEKGTTEK